MNDRGDWSDDRVASASVASEIQPRQVCNLPQDQVHRVLLLDGSCTPPPHMPPQAQSRWRIAIEAPPKHVDDVEVQRRRQCEDDGVESLNVKRRRTQCTLLVDFCPSSSVAACGTQVWAASLLLADYLVHIGPSLEVGCLCPPLSPLPPFSPSPLILVSKKT